VEISSSRLASLDKPADEATIVPQGTTTLSAQSTVRIPKGEAVVVSASQSAAERDSRETLVLISASVAPAGSAASAADKSAAANEEKTLQVYALRNAEARQTAELLRSIASSPLQVGVDLRTNSLIVRTADENRAEIEALLMRLDSEEPQREARQRP
jgi:type II secretory pathway component GspD/PulD (secretin)